MNLAHLPYFAIISGLFGTAASVFGKLIQIKDIQFDSNQTDLFWRCSFKAVYISLMVLCNMFVWTFFVKSLHQPGGSIVATVTSTATSYCFSI
ncbi:uncharacterized protein LOC116352162 isoform X2 [Contarinia nasturtii]|uniref:uncharacterized protein LOC116352162 isoform X2 n=1 Tax=Contarinia nasturtii TaxID=265458 RepID=UPI0012D3F0B3|nr:uncharacterized protein LOC116352162 isoform X2 [Contarinia nasturtii]